MSFFVNVLHSNVDITSSPRDLQKCSLRSLSFCIIWASNSSFDISSNAIQSMTTSTRVAQQTIWLLLNHHLDRSSKLPNLRSIDSLVPKFDRHRHLLPAKLYPCL